MLKKFAMIMVVILGTTAVLCVYIGFTESLNKAVMLGFGIGFLSVISHHLMITYYDYRVKSRYARKSRILSGRGG
jgi:hypothetical protein